MDQDDILRKRVDELLPHPTPYDDQAHYDRSFTGASDILSRREIDQGHVDRCAEQVRLREQPYHERETDADRLVRRATRTMFQAWHDATVQRLAEQTAQRIAQQAGPAPQQVAPVHTQPSAAQGERAHGR